MKRLWIVSVPLCAVVMLSADINGMYKAVAESPIGAASTLLPQGNAQGNDQSANVSGKWQLSWQGRRGRSMQIALTLKQDGTKLSGTLDGLGRMHNSSLPLTGSMEGNNVSFTVTGARIPRVFKGTVDGDQMSGTTQQGTPWTATRQEQ